jgi:hypothetical protein
MIPFCQYTVIASKKIKTYLSHSFFTGRFYYIIAVCISLLTFTKEASAWVYPEHRRLSFLAIQNLSPQYRAELDRLWLNARTGYELRLSESIINPDAGKTSNQLDYASWAAISGDHSCSPADMLNTVLLSSWILRVEKVTAKFGESLAKAKNNTQRLNALRLSDMQLLRADDAYASRAGSNNVHFLLPRDVVNMNLPEYFAACTAKNAASNALASYAWFHTSALEKAYRYHHHTGSSQKEKNELILSALADEAFAAHFLQDIFAAGHVAGSWGKASQRKGTHDHYNVAGLEVQTWGGKRMILMGDAYLKEEDAILISKIVGESIEQLINAANGKMNNASLKKVLHPSNQPDSLNVCQSVSLPERVYDTTMIHSIVLQMPVPGLKSGPGSLPRINAELGPFIGISAALSGSGIGGGFGANQNEPGGIAGMEANIRIGIGLDGVVNRSGDGLMFLQFGWKQDAASSNNYFYTGGGGGIPNSIASAIPPRTAYNLRFRLPYFLIPGDLIFASPLYLFSPKTYTKMAEAAVNGGLLHLQSAIATGIGRFQFVLGREIGLSFYGVRDPKDFIIIPDANGKVSIVEYQSTKIDIPLFEYVPTRTFSQNQTANVMIQFSMGVDIPHNSSVLAPVGDPLPELKPVTYAGFRIIFNWRRYL